MKTFCETASIIIVVCTLAEFTLRPRTYCMSLKIMPSALNFVSKNTSFAEHTRATNNHTNQNVVGLLNSHV